MSHSLTFLCGEETSYKVTEAAFLERRKRERGELYCDPIKRRIREQDATTLWSHFEPNYMTYPMSE